MKSLAQRYAAQQAKDVEAMTGHSLTPAPALTPVHEQFMAVVNNLLNWCEQSLTADSPAIVRTSLTVVKRMQSQLIGKVGEVDPSAIAQIARELRDELDSIVIAALPVIEGSHSDGSDDERAIAGADQPA